MQHMYFLVITSPIQVKNINFIWNKKIKEKKSLNMYAHMMDK